MDLNKSKVSRHIFKCINVDDKWLFQEQVLNKITMN